MSKIFFKVNNKKADDVEKENAEIPVTENTAVATEPAPEQKKSDEPVQIALFPKTSNGTPPRMILPPIWAKSRSIRKR